MDLGQGVVLYEGNDGSVLNELAQRIRFLNCLWLPCALAELSVEQICVINRFRESRMDSDPQFLPQMRSRASLAQTIRSLMNPSVLEIGCGKFPLNAGAGFHRYRGIEVDEDAIAYCRDRGLDVGTMRILNDGVTFDIAVSLYVFHFAINPEVISFIDRHVTENGVLIFNAIVDDGLDLLNKLALLSAYFPIFRIIKSPPMPRREFFFVLCRLGNQQLGSDIAAALGDALNRE